MVETRFYNLKPGYYALGQDSYNDWGIYLLYELLQYFGFGLDLLRNELENPESTGIGSPIVVMDLEGDKVYLWSHFDDDQVEFKFDRHHLFELINKWDELIKHDVQEIVIRRDGERFEISTIGASYIIE